MNLIEGLQFQMNRVREIIKEYDEVGPAGAFASALMKADIQGAERAIATGDTIEMMVRYSSLSEWQES